MPAERSCEKGLEPYSGPARAAELSILVREIDTHALTITVELALCFPQGVFERIEGNHNRRAFMSLNGSLRPTQPRLMNTHVAVLFESELTNGGDESGEPLRRETTLGRLMKGRTQPVFDFGHARLSPDVSLGRVTLPLTAVPRRYPFDWYALQGAGAVVLRDEHLHYKHAPESLLPTIPIKIHLYASPSLSPLALEAAVNAEPEDFEVDLTLRRSRATQWYVGVIASIPLLLALLLVVVLWQPGARTDIGVETIAGVAAALLAVLPIRLVLVPALASELTLVDYWLGFEMAVLAAIACLAVRRAI
jgi:hypothetical protein